MPVRGRALSPSGLRPLPHLSDGVTNFPNLGLGGGGTVHGVSVLTPPEGPRQHSTNIVLIIRIISTIVIIRGRWTFSK